uniref:Uncharacterized protein n=1 Tax=Chrysotila carterae TaxID=13221 RepID=A0A7S4BJ91_CHRCT
MYSADTLAPRARPDLQFSAFHAAFGMMRPDVARHDAHTHARERVLEPLAVRKRPPKDRFKRLRLAQKRSIKVCLEASAQRGRLDGILVKACGDEGGGNG